MPDATRGLKYANAQEEVLHKTKLRLHDRLARRGLSLERTEAYKEILAWIESYEHSVYLTKQINQELVSSKIS